MAEEKKKRKRLVEIRSRQADDGTIVHHHTYEKHDGGEEAERQNVATSQSPEEAGEHTQEQFGMNPPAADPGAPDPAGGGGAPDPTAGGGAAPGQ